MAKVRLPQSVYNKSNQFPGSGAGMSIEQLRAYTKDQKKIKGFRFAIPVSVSLQNLQLPGEARFLLGFKIFTATQPFLVGFSILLNNEQIVDNANVNMLNILSIASNNQQEYLKIHRMLSGQDTLTIQFDNQDVAAYDAHLMAFYL